MESGRKWNHYLSFFFFCQFFLVARIAHSNWVGSPEPYRIASSELPSLSIPPYHPLMGLF